MNVSDSASNNVSKDLLLFVVLTKKYRSCGSVCTSIKVNWMVNKHSVIASFYPHLFIPHCISSMHLKACIDITAQTPVPDHFISAR